MFEQDVAGLIKALRANKNDEDRVIQQAFEETRKEIKSKDLEVKAAAILKLVYLEMLGHSIAFASFAIVECMSSTKYHIKSIGYLAASQCFDRETEVAVLVVNLVKKDLLSPPTPLFSTSPSSLTVAHLLSTLSAVSLLLTPPLARDLAPELLSMLSHSRPQIRRQTVLVLWRVHRSWPGVKELGTGREEAGDDPWIERLRERLADEDIGVVSATVNLICELARKDPRTYLPLAPELFGLLTASTNNWMLIKIIKLFAVLTPEEPRLVKKLVPPLTELIETTPAMSLLYECIQTSIVGGMLQGRDGEALAATCVDKLKNFLEDADQNLRYIALVALVKILPTHPHLVAIHHDTILTCTDDPDTSIRMRALDLVEGMVDRKTLQPIVERLMVHLRPATSPASNSISAAAHVQAQQVPDAPPPPGPIILSASYRTSLIALILRMCSSSTYSNVANFQWYINILIELSYLSLALPIDSTTTNGNGTTTLGAKLRDQLVDVGARVKAIRPFVVKKVAQLLEDDTFLENGEGPEVAEVLGAAAWICGEYCRELQDPRPVIASLFGSTTSTLPPRILSLYVHNGVKIYASWLSALSDNWDEDDLDQVRSVTSALEEQLGSCAASSDIELQERSAELRQLLILVRNDLDAPRPLPPRSSSQNGFGSESADPYDESQGFGSTSTSATLLPPSCLTLLSPLFFSHELNPVNPKAQSMVALPEGLDLDSIIVPESSLRAKELFALSEDEGEVDDYGRPIGRARYEEDMGRSESVGRKKKSGKGKIGTSKKGKRRQVEDDLDELARLKAERLERQKEDPYYVGSSAPSTRTYHDDDSDDVDSIPIVQLSLDDFSAPTSRRPLPPREPTPPPVFIDVEGELPEEGLRAELGVQGTLSASGSGTATPEVTEEEKVAETKAEEGLVKKVMKKKKKVATGMETGTGKVKKKKVAVESST